MLSPIGILGGIRGVLFANMGGRVLPGHPSVLGERSETVRPIVRVHATWGGCLRDPRRISGFRLVDGRASYGLGLETFALGFPIHFDWSWRTLFNKEWEDVLFYNPSGTGSEIFRRSRFDMWIGYDF